MKSTVMKLEDLPLSLNVAGVAGVLGISKANAYELCKSNGFPCVKIGKRMIITKLAFVKWMESTIYDGGKVSTSLVIKIHNVLHGALDQAVKNQLVNRNVSDGVELPAGRF